MGTWDPPQPPQSPPTPGFGVTGSSQLAGVGARIVAWIVDWLILLVVTYVLYFLFNALHVGTLGGLLGFAISLGYWTYFWGRNGQTPGDMVMHIRVQTQTGAPLGYGVAFLRGLLVDLSFWLCAIPAIISLIMIATTEKRQAIHDLIVGTNVVDA